MSSRYLIDRGIGEAPRSQNQRNVIAPKHIMVLESSGCWSLLMVGESSMLVLKMSFRAKTDVIGSGHEPAPAFSPVKPRDGDEGSP